MTAPASFLSIRSLTKQYGAINVINDLSLDVTKGEFVSILGASGCGKTTLLRMIAGFIDPTAGQIVLDDQRIDTLPNHRREAAMVFQNYALFPHLTVFENVAFGLRRRKVAEKELRRRTEESLALVELIGLEGRFPNELSGGQQQRVALARAIVLEPKLLLLDEPLSNLDARLRKQLRADFLKVHRAAGITSLFVTHDLEEAFGISDRVAIINRGHLEQFDKPTELFWQPRTAYVANFIGHSNIIAGTRSRADAGTFVRIGNLSIRVPDDAPGRSASRYAIPWQLLRLDAGAPLPDENRFSAVVADIAYLGHSIALSLDIEGLRLSSQLPATRELAATRVGDRVTVAWRASDMISLPSEEA